MKKPLALLVTLFLSQLLFSQELVRDYKTTSSAGKFIETKGLILKIEHYKNYVITGVNFGLETIIYPGIITDVRSGEKRAYVKVRSSYKEMLYESVIDFDEIPACIEALEYIIEIETNNKPSNYTDVFFKTKDELEIGARTLVFGQEFSWKTSIAHMKYVRTPSFEISIKKLPKVVEALKESMALLEEKMSS